MPSRLRFLMLFSAAGALALALTAPIQPAHAQRAEKGEKAEKAAPAKKGAAAKAAEPAPAAAAPASAWAVTCTDRGQAAFKCEMTQTLIDEKTRGPLLVLSVTRDAAVTNLIMRVPHGVFLPGGVNLKIDQSEPRKLAFQRSDAAGVYCAMTLDDKTVEAMSRGRALSVGLELMPGQPIELPARLDGFEPALQRLVSTR